MSKVRFENSNCCFVTEFLTVLVVLIREMLFGLWSYSHSRCNWPNWFPDQKFEFLKKKFIDWVELHFGIFLVPVFQVVTGGYLSVSKVLSNCWVLDLFHSRFDSCFSNLQFGMSISLFLTKIEEWCLSRWAEKPSHFHMFQLSSHYLLIVVSIAQRVESSMKLENLFSHTLVVSWSIPTLFH